MAESDVEVRFGANIEGLIGSMAQVRESLEGLTEPIRGVRDNLGELGEAFLAAFAVERVGEFAEKMGELGEATSRASQILGIPTEEIGKLQLVAQESGISLDELEQSFGRLSRGLIEGSDSTKRALAALGLSISDLKGKDAEEQIQILSDRLSTMKDGAEKDAIAMALLGRAGENMIPFFNQGGDAMERIGALAERLGIALKGDVVEALEGTHRGLIEMTDAIQGAAIQVFLEFKGTIDGVVQIVRDLAVAFSDAMRSGGVLKDLFNGLVVVVQGVVSALALAIAAFRSMEAAAVFAVDEIHAGFMILGITIADVFRDLIGGVAGFFTGLVTTARTATSSVGEMFVNLGSVIASALEGHFGDASAAFGRLKTDASSSLSAIGDSLKGAVNSFNFSNIAKDNAPYIAQSKATYQEYAQTIKTITGDLQTELSKIWQTGAKEEEKIKQTHDGNMAAADKGAAKDAADAALAEINGEIQVLQAGLRQKEQIINGEYQLHQISEQQKVQQTRQAVQEEYEAELALLEKESQIGGLKLAQHQEILNKIKLLEMQHNTEMLKLDQEAAQDTAKTWTQSLNTIASAFNSQLSGLLAGTTSWRTAMANIFKDLTMKAIEWVEQMVIKWIAGEAAKTTATTTGVAARTAAEQGGSLASLASNFASMVKSILGSAAQTFAGIFGFLSPVMGPAAVGPAAAGEAAVASVASAVPSLAVGTWGLSDDSLIQAHQGEMIVPAFQSDKLRSAIDALESGSGGGGGDVHHHWNVTAMDGRSVIQVLRQNADEITKMVSKGLSQPGLRPNYGR